jgi:cytochrome c551/c552
MNRFRLSLSILIPLCASIPVAAQKSAASDQAFISKYCQGCHNNSAKAGGLSLQQLDPSQVSASSETWEKVIRKLRSGMMPPSGAPRPERAAIDDFTGRLATSLDKSAALHPNPGNVGLHRLNRAEYGNAVRDLLGVNVDVSTLLPSDDSSEGFDNIAAALGISPALLERYVGAATKVSRLAVGDPATAPSTETWRVPGDLSQTAHLEGLPFGTRGGILFQYTFPLDAEYAFKVRARNAGLGVGAGGGPFALELTLDGARIDPGKSTTDFRLKITAGPHTIGVAMPEHNLAGVDDVYGVYADNAGVTTVAVTGPTNPTGPGDTPSRRKIFVCHPAAGEDETVCAKKILTSLASKAFRREVRDGDLETLLGFYQEGKNSGGFEHGIEAAVARLLIDPWFIFRFEKEPARVAPGGVYTVSDIELASRLSFFLWSSIPDEELLRLATQKKLHDPQVLAQQTRRMLADPRASALTTNFAGQWLYLRELKSARPESRDFNDNLRQSFRRETELLFDSIVREDRSVVDLLNANYTFVDERLAKHYGIPGVYGSRFRRVQLPDDTRRGLLGQGSILLVTSVATRTSPVARGKWVLENVLGTSAPLPPPNVPALPEDPTATRVVSVREKMEAHRQNPVCAACHKIMDPIGFSLENFDLTGKWRATDGGVQIDSSSQMVDGTKLSGPASLREALMSRSDVFVSTLTEKLMTYALGRGLKYYDMPAVRAVTHEARSRDDRFSAIVLAIVKSAPFQMKMKPVEDTRTPVQTAALR